MEEAEKYEQCTKEEFIQIIQELKETIEALKKERENSKPPLPKDSTNSSIPTSKELIKRTRSQREKSGKKSGGQKGHQGFHRERNPNPDCVVEVEAKECKHCGRSLEGIEGQVGQIAQEVDIPVIRPLTTEYRQVIKTCPCGECNSVPLPISGYVNIGPRMGAFITYLNVEHALPYERLSQITHDLLGFPISEGTIENKLTHMQKQAKGILASIKELVIRAKWIAIVTKQEPRSQGKGSGIGSGNPHWLPIL